MTELINWDAAVVKVRDLSGFTPLHCACHKKLLRIVKAFEAQLEHEDVREAQTHHTENTPLHIACRNGDSALEIVKYLIGKNANVNAKNKKGETPIHICAIKGFKKLTEELLRGNVDVDDKDVLGYTPIIHAALNSQDLIPLLLPRYTLYYSEP